MERDRAVIRNIQKSIHEARKKSNRGKVLVFDDETTSRVVDRNELAKADCENAILLLHRLGTFAMLYEMEIELATGPFPFIELADELDEIIERFQTGEWNLSRDIERVRRKFWRNKTKAFIEGLFGLISLIVLIPLSELSKVLTYLYFMFPIIIFVIMGITANGIWTQFAPLFRENPSV